MTALELFRSGMDTMQIAEHLGVEEWQAYRMLSAARREEHARLTGSRMQPATCRPEQKKPRAPIRFAGFDAGERP